MYVMVFDRQHVETIQVDIFSSESDDVVKKCGSVSFHVYSFDLFRLLINTIFIVPIIFDRQKVTLLQPHSADLFLIRKGWIS